MKFRWPFYTPTTTGEVKTVSDTSVLGGFLDFFTKRLSTEKEISDKLIKAFEGWVYINVSTLAESVSLMELELFQFRMIKGQVELEPIEEHEILDLLNRFNDATTQSEAVYNTESHLDLTGDCFWLLDGGKNKNKPDNIFLLQPDAVSVELGDFSDASARLIEGYKYKITVDGETLEKNYEPEEVLHFKVPNPQNPYRGKSTVEAIASTLDMDTYAEQALLNLFRNGLIGDFYLNSEKRMTPEQLKNFAAQFRAAFQGVRNAWKVPILYGGVKPEKLMMSGREMQLIEIEEWLRNKIMSAFKNTRASLGIDDEVNRSTSESSLLNWKRSIVAPKMARIVDNLNEFLVPRYGENLLLGFKDPVPEDRGSEIKEATDLFNAKIITKNEARKIIDYEEVEGGDEFETLTLNPLQDFGKQIKKIPSLKYVKTMPIFRKAGVFSQAKEFKELKAKALPIARQIVNGKKKAPKQREHSKFTNEQVWKYWEKQIAIVEQSEGIFENQLQQFIKETLEEGLSKLDDEEARKKSRLIDVGERKQDAINKFTPILNEVLVISGQLANNLIGRNEPYIPTKQINTREEIRDQILLFASSMLETDIDLLVAELAAGLEEGKSIAQIRRAIQDRMPDFTKNQAERITRTEVLKSSNLGAQDAFEQSGVVVAKQWLTAEDDRVDPLCASLNGKIVSLESQYFKKGDSVEINGKVFTMGYSDTPYPPIHPSCRCTILPVIKGQEDFDIRSFEVFQELKSKITELEAKVDKRTKAYRDLKEEKLEVDQYVTELEKLANE